VKISPTNIWEDIVIELPRVRVAVQGILEGFLPLDFFKQFFGVRKFFLAPMFASMSPKAGGWTKASLVAVSMKGTSLEANSNCLATAGEEPSPTSDSCNFGALGDFLVEGFFEGIVLAIKNSL